MRPVLHGHRGSTSHGIPAPVGGSPGDGGHSDRIRSIQSQSVASDATHLHRAIVIGRGRNNRYCGRSNTCSYGNTDVIGTGDFRIFIIYQVDGMGPGMQVSGAILVCPAVNHALATSGSFRFSRGHRNDFCTTCIVDYRRFRYDDLIDTCHRRFRIGRHLEVFRDINCDGLCGCPRTSIGSSHHQGQFKGGAASGSSHNGHAFSRIGAADGSSCNRPEIGFHALGGRVNILRGRAYRISSCYGHFRRRAVALDLQNKGHWRLTTLLVYDRPRYRVGPEGIVTRYGHGHIRRGIEFMLGPINQQHRAPVDVSKWLGPVGRSNQIAQVWLRYATRCIVSCQIRRTHRRSRQVQPKVLGRQRFTRGRPRCKLYQEIFFCIAAVQIQDVARFQIAGHRLFIGREALDIQFRIGTDIHSADNRNGRIATGIGQSEGNGVSPGYRRIDCASPRRSHGSAAIIHSGCTCIGIIIADTKGHQGISI